MPKIIKKRKNVIAQLLIVTVFSLWGFTSFGGAEAAAETVAPATSNINVNLSDGISIRVLDGTATTDLTDLAFDFAPTDAGVSNTKTAVVEVGTSNETGYTLYMHSDWDDHDGNKTTSLVHTTGTVDDIIPTRLGSTYPFWYYHNAFFDEDKAIPAYGASEQLAINREAIDADRTVVPITVGVDTSVVSGTYRNKLVFTAVANEIPTEPWRIFLRLGGYNSYGYESFEDAMEDEEIYTKIFDDETAMGYLTDNEDLIDGLRALDNYSEKLVPELLESDVYTDEEKYEYGLPFYLFNNGTINVAAGFTQQWRSLYRPSSTSSSVSIGTTISLSTYASPDSCVRLFVRTTTLIEVGKYNAMGVNVDSTGGGLYRGTALGDGTVDSDGRVNLYYQGADNITTTGKNYNGGLAEATGEYYPGAYITHCTGDSTLTTTTVVISQLWLE